MPTAGAPRPSSKASPLDAGPRTSPLDATAEHAVVAELGGEQAPARRPTNGNHPEPPRERTADKPGWYPDPARRSLLRYRSGAGWTSHVLDWRGAPRVDELFGTAPRRDNGQLGLTFRLGRTRRLVHLAAGGVLVLVALLAFLVADQPFLGALLALPGLAVAAHGVLMRSFSVVLSDSGVVLRGWRTSYHSWPEVHAIEPINFAGARRVRVELKGGSSVRLWAPYDDVLEPDPKFDRKVAAMQQWHLDQSPLRRS